jgi:hypothetical protein
MKLNPKVSVLENCHSDKVTGETTIENWLKSDQHKDEVLKYRSAASAKEKREILKNLPAITPRATFHENLSPCNVIGYTDMLYVQITNGALWAFRNLEIARCHLVAHMPELISCSLSLSGEDLDLLIHVGGLRGSFDSHGKSLVSILFRTRLEICHVRFGDLTDTMIASSDPNPFVNLHARKMTFGSSLSEQKYYCEKRIEGLIEQVISNKISLSAPQQKVLGTELAYVLGDNGRDLYHDLLKAQPEYDKSKCEKRYDKLLEEAFLDYLSTDF